MKSIPASFFVKIIPGVIAAGGAALVLNGIALTNSTRIPIGDVFSYPSQKAVAAYFGASSDEAGAATKYFLGDDISTVKPGAMLFTQYNPTAVPAWLRGGSMAGVTLTQLQAMSGGLAVTVDGLLHTSAAIVLTSATSFSNAVAIILAAFTTPLFTMSYDSIASAFMITSGTTGATSTMSFASGSLAHPLGLLETDGALVSQGADAAVPGPFMDGVTGVTQNWATFFTTFDPDGGAGNTQKLLFAAWDTAQGDTFAYVAWDTDLSPTASNVAAASMGRLMMASEESGTCLVYGTTCEKAAFISGTVASIDFTATAGRTNFAYRTQAGMAGDIADEGSAANLVANGYNFYGNVAARSANFSFLWNGSVCGRFQWLDSYVNQIWLNAGCQLAWLQMQLAMKSIPYTGIGTALMHQWLADPINAAINFGAIRENVPLTAAQAIEVNTAAGVAIDQILSTEGWYLQILVASGQVRQARGAPPATLWYTDGGSVNQLSLNSIDVQ